MSDLASRRLKSDPKSKGSLGKGRVQSGVRAGLISLTRRPSQGSVEGGPNLIGAPLGERASAGGFPFRGRPRGAYHGGFHQAGGTPIATTYAIDFGTSNSLLAAVRDGQPPEAVPLDPAAPDPSVLRSVFFASDKDRWFFGAEAIDEYVQQAASGRLFRSVKKYLPDPSFQQTEVNGRSLSLVDLVAKFLGAMRERAGERLGADVTAAVFGRPAAFSEDPEKDALAQKRLETAARAAGFRAVEFLPEPVAAALDLKRTLKEPKRVLVADYGGGTSDFTVIELSEKPFRREDVLAVGGLSVAGDLFDGSIMQHMLAPHFGTEIVYRLPMGSNELRLPKHLIRKLCSPPDITFLGRSDVMRLMKETQRYTLTPEHAARLERLFTLVEEHLGYALFREIERCKVQMAAAPEARFHMPEPGIELETTLASKTFFETSQDLVERIVATMDETLRRAGTTAERIDLVFATGGTAKLPSLRRELVRRFGEARLSESRHFHAVVTGLAEYARQLA